MRKYAIIITSTALLDIKNIHRYIAFELLEPATASKYVNNIHDTIKHLSLYGASIAVSDRDFLLSKYGSTVRNINYKKMAVIYTIENNKIIIQRIMAAALIL